MAVAGEFLSDRQCLHSLGHPQIARRTHGLQSDAGARIERSLPRQFERAGHPVDDRGKHPHTGRTSLRLRGREYRFQKRQIDLIKMAKHPQGLKPIVFERGRRGGELGQPGLYSRHHFSFRPTGKFNPGPVPYPVDRIGQQRHQLRHLATGDRHRFRYRFVGHHHPVDPAMDPIAAGIAQVVLHVADDRVLPVGEIDRPVGAHLQIGRPEIRIARRHDRLHLDRLWKRGVARLELILQNSLKADHVAHQQVALQVAGKMRAGEKLDAGAGAGALVVNTRGTAMLVHAIEPRGKDRAPVGNRSGAVDSDVVSPGAEGMPVRIGERIGGVEAKLAGAGLILEDGAVGRAHRCPPWGFPL